MVKLPSYWLPTGDVVLEKSPAELSDSWASNVPPLLKPPTWTVNVRVAVSAGAVKEKPFPIVLMKTPFLFAPLLAVGVPSVQLNGL
jgi:hypothetical protein